MHRKPITWLLLLLLAIIIYYAYTRASNPHDTVVSMSVYAQTPAPSARVYWLYDVTPIATVEWVQTGYDRLCVSRIASPSRAQSGTDLLMGCTPGVLAANGSTSLVAPPIDGNARPLAGDIYRIDFEAADTATVSIVLELPVPFAIYAPLIAR